jgi:hypothetical protein
MFLMAYEEFQNANFSHLAICQSTFPPHQRLAANFIFFFPILIRKFIIICRGKEQKLCFAKKLMKSLAKSHNFDTPLLVKQIYVVDAAPLLF